MTAAKRVTMTIGEAVRCASMDCEASRPTAALVMWIGQDGKIHKRVFPASQIIEDGLLHQLDRLPPGSTKAPGTRPL
jgi:hypothetical protein